MIGVSHIDCDVSSARSARMRQGPRVLCLASFLPTTGCGQTMAPLARQIDSLREVGVDVSCLQIEGLPKLKYLQTLAPLRRAARDVDIVHAHYGFCGWLGKTVSRPLVISFMGDDLLGTRNRTGGVSRLSRAYVASSRWIAGRAEAVIVKSQEMADVLAPLACHVIPNGVDLNVFAPRDRSIARQRLGWADDRQYVLFPGNPDDPNKGYRWASAAVDMAQVHCSAPLELKVLQNVEPADVPVFMNACDAMLMVSYSEGSPNVVKEAMASELPVVSVPVGDVPQLFQDADGFLLADRDAESIGAMLSQVLEQRPRTSGREVLQRRELDARSVALRIAKVYDQVLEHCG